MSDTSELCYLPASEALRLFRSRELSPVELMESVIARADEVEPTVNALCHRFTDRALEQAREAEARYMGKGRPPRALEGIPTAVKEEEPIAGQPWTQGSLIYEDLVAEETSNFAQRMLDAGVIVHARTTAPEFSSAGFTHSQNLGGNPRSLEFQARCRRLVGRVGCGACGRDVDACEWLRHLGFDPHPCLFQRRRRLQATVRTCAAGRAVQSRHVLPLWADGAHCP